MIAVTVTGVSKGIKAINSLIPALPRKDDYATVVPCLPHNAIMQKLFFTSERRLCG